MDDDPEERLRRLYAANAPALLAYALRRGASREDAADLVSDVFLAAWRRIDGVPAGDEGRLWLYGVAHTGFFPGAGDTESAPGEDFLDTGKPGIVEVVRGLTTEAPLPQGASWAPLLARYPAPETVLTQRSVLGQEVEWYARCRWEEAAGWRYTAASDGGGVVANLSETAAAAAAGDVAPVRQEHRANCG